MLLNTTAKMTWWKVMSQSNVRYSRKMRKNRTCEERKRCIVHTKNPCHDFNKSSDIRFTEKVSKIRRKGNMDADWKEVRPPLQVTSENAKSQWTDFDICSVAYREVEMAFLSSSWTHTQGKFWACPLLVCHSRYSMYVANVPQFHQHLGH